MTGGLLILSAAVAYGGWAYFHPFKRCGRCKGTGVNTWSTKHRSGRCGRCKGARSVQTPGSRVLHRAVRSMTRYRSDRKKEK